MAHVQHFLRLPQFHYVSLDLVASISITVVHSYSQFTSAGLAEIYDLKQMGALGDPKHVPINYRHFCGEILSILRFLIFEYNAHTDNIRV